MIKYILSFLLVFTYVSEISAQQSKADKMHVAQTPKIIQKAGAIEGCHIYSDGELFLVKKEAQKGKEIIHPKTGIKTYITNIGVDDARYQITIPLPELDELNKLKTYVLKEDVDWHPADDWFPHVSWTSEDLFVSFKTLIESNPDFEGKSQILKVSKKEGTPNQHLYPVVGVYSFDQDKLVRISLVMESQSKEFYPSGEMIRIVNIQVK